jgi:hypothetical protein
MRYSLQFKALPKKGKNDDPNAFPPKDEQPAGGMPEGSPVDESAEDPAEEATETPKEEAAEPVEGDPAEEAQETPAEEAAEPADEPTDQEAPPEVDPNAPQPFSGDVYTEGDETDPAEAFAHLKGEDGTEAWLDHDPQGTIVGWVRTPDGTVYRYSDPAAWAIDADDAGLHKVGGTMDGGAPAEAETPAEDAGEPGEETPPAADGESVDGEEPGLDNRNKRFSFEGKSYEITYS